MGREFILLWVPAIPLTPNQWLGVKSYEYMSIWYTVYDSYDCWLDLLLFNSELEHFNKF
jgi:hypothetical protein